MPDRSRLLDYLEHSRQQLEQQFEEASLHLNNQLKELANNLHQTQLDNDTLKSQLLDQQQQKENLLLEREALEARMKSSEELIG